MEEWQTQVAELAKYIAPETMLVVINNTETKKQLCFDAHRHWHLRNAETDQNLGILSTDELLTEYVIVTNTISVADTGEYPINYLTRLTEYIAKYKERLLKVICGILLRKFVALQELLDSTQNMATFQQAICCNCKTMGILHHGTPKEHVAILRIERWKETAGDWLCPLCVSRMRPRGDPSRDQE